MAWMTSKINDLVHRQITGRRPEAPVTDLGTAVTNTYGTNRLGNPNVRSAAADLGVAEGTLRRWLKGSQHPSGDNVGKDTGMIQRAEQARQEKMRDSDYRTTSMPPGRANRLSKNGMRIKIKADSQISSDLRKGREFPTIRLDSEEAAKVLQAWQAGDDATFRAGLEDALAEHYLDGLHTSLEQLHTIKITR